MEVTSSQKLTVGGAVTYWRLAKSTNRAALADGLRPLGLDRYTPEPRSPLACLRAALQSVYPAPKARRARRARSTLSAP